MDDIRLPAHVVETIERRWAVKLADEARLWREKRSLSASSAAERPRVVRRRKLSGRSEPTPDTVSA
jgi:hypothetical protein